MKLGKYDLGTPVFLAPMAGVTDKAFRETVQLVGAKCVWTEMISDKALNYRNSRTLNMLNLEGEPEPRIVQLFGSDAKNMAQAARIVEDFGADVIDINMGCPTPKIIKNGEGSALMRNVSLAKAIAEAVVKSVQIPVTVKIRIGWTLEEANALTLASLLEEAGVQMLTLHARTREQFYSGQADWTWIKKLKETVKIPVIGNGDITGPEDARLCIEQTGCDGVMIGRAALGNPWAIAKTQHFFETGQILPEPSLVEKVKVIEYHFERLLRYKGERIGLNEMRKHAAWYVKGFKNAAQHRDKIMQTKSVQEMKEIFMDLLVKAE